MIWPCALRVFHGYVALVVLGRVSYKFGTLGGRDDHGHLITLVLAGARLWIVSDLISHLDILSTVDTIFGWLSPIGLVLITTHVLCCCIWPTFLCRYSLAL